MKIHTDVPAEEVQIQIIPLIDVIFCILTFFILAALQFTRQQAIRVDLPKASTGTPLSVPGIGDTRFREMLVVTIGSTGQTFIDKRPVDRGQLLQEFRAYIGRKPGGLLVLNASPNAFYNDVIQVIDLMRAVGGDRVALATVPTTSPSTGTTLTQPGLSPIPSPSPTFNPFDPFATPGNGLGSPTPGTAPFDTTSPLNPDSSRPSEQTSP